MAKRRGIFGKVVLGVLICGAVGIVIIRLKGGPIKTTEPEPPIAYEVARKWDVGSTGIGYEVFVDADTTKEEAIALGEYFREKYSIKSILHVAIFNNEEAARNRNNPNYPG